MIVPKRRLLVAAIVKVLVPFQTTPATLPGLGLNITPIRIQSLVATNEGDLAGIRAVIAEEGLQAGFAAGSEVALEFG